MSTVIAGVSVGVAAVKCERESGLRHSLAECVLIPVLFEKRRQASPEHGLGPALHAELTKRPEVLHRVFVDLSLPLTNEPSDLRPLLLLPFLQKRETPRALGRRTLRPNAAPSRATAASWRLASSRSGGRGSLSAERRVVAEVELDEPNRFVRARELHPPAPAPFVHLVEAIPGEAERLVRLSRPCITKNATHHRYIHVDSL